MYISRIKTTPKMHKQEKNSKVYEKLDYIPKPENYNSNIPWTVQQQIAATNGIHYIDRVGKLKDYPVYELPIDNVKSTNKLSLDIGCGWGRWLIASANKGYTPVGIDLRLEFCSTSRNVLKDFGINGYVAVADLENIPFQDNTFDFIWSFSVIQHTHHKRLVNCLEHINRILTKEGFTMLEFPNKKGIRNNIKNVKFSESRKDDYESWCVRYYTPNEYQEIFEKSLSNFSYKNHSFLGIGILKEDIKYVSLKNKIICLTSRAFSELTKVIPGLKDYSDSIYISAEKKGYNSTYVNSLATFNKKHLSNPTDNLNIVSLLRCPKYGGEVELSSDRKRVISKGNGIYYPIENDIPIMISSEALQM